jgi:hypothetical protein
MTRTIRRGLVARQRDLAPEAQRLYRLFRSRWEERGESQWSRRDLWRRFRGGRPSGAKARGERRGATPLDLDRALNELIRAGLIEVRGEGCWPYGTRRTPRFTLPSIKAVDRWEDHECATR